MPSSARVLDALLARSPAQAVFDRRSESGLAVLAYHHTPNREAFGAQIDWLCRKANPVSLDQVIASLDGSRELPPRATLVTFDDADPSLLHVASPVLEGRGVPAVAFVVSGLLDTCQPFWWEEVKALVEAGGWIRTWTDLAPLEIIRRLTGVPDSVRVQLLDELRETASRPVKARPQLRKADLRSLERAGIAVGNHTVTHPCLPKCPTAKIDREIREAHIVLKDALGHEPRAFAYPNGDHDPRVRSALRQVGYRAAFLFDHRLCRWPPKDPLRISRLRVNSMAGPDRFRLILSGLHPFLHHALGRP